MLLGSKFHTVGDKKKWTVDYGNWLEQGVTIATCPVTCTDTSVTISATTIVEGHKVTFFVQGATANQSFTVALVMTDTKGGVKNDTISYTPVTP